VEQVFSKIPVSTKFSREDAEGNGHEDVPATEAQDTAKSATTATETKRSKQQKVTDWDEIFGSVVGEESSAAQDGEVQEGLDADSDEEGSEQEGTLNDEEAEEGEGNDTNDSEEDSGIEEKVSSSKGKAKATRGLPSFKVTSKKGQGKILFECSYYISNYNHHILSQTVTKRTRRKRIQSQRHGV
jgi:nuclear GTP-binding protein